MDLFNASNNLAQAGVVEERSISSRVSLKNSRGAFFPRTGVSIANTNGTGCNDKDPSRSRPAVMAGLVVAEGQSRSIFRLPRFNQRSLQGVTPGNRCFFSGRVSSPLLNG